MTKHRTITGFVAVALLAVAAAATMKSHTPWTRGIVVASDTTSQDVAADASASPAADFNDRWSALSALSPSQQPSR